MGSQSSKTHNAFNADRVSNADRSEPVSLTPAEQPIPAMDVVRSRGIVTNSLPEPDDRFLIECLASGEARALSRLMERYDRLVRYTIFRLSKDRCARDPLWLDSLASSVWAGFVDVIRNPSRTRPDSVQSFLVTITRNHVVSALRSASRSKEVASGNDFSELQNKATVETPVALLQRLELLDHMRCCVSELDEADRRLISQLAAIMDRRWRDAAAELDRSESTLRSQWKRLLERLRASFSQRTGEPLAPEDLGDD